MRKILIMVLLVAFAAIVGVSCAKTADSGLNYVPGSASVVGQIDVAKLFTIKAVKDGVTENEGKDEDVVELKKLGVSSETVKKVSFGLDLTKTVKGKDPEGIVVIELTTAVTDQAKVIELIKKKNPDLAIQFISGTIAVIGTPEMVAAAARLKAGAGSASKNTALMAVASKANKNGLIWIAATIPADQLKKLGEKAGPDVPLKGDQVKDLVLGADYSDAAGLSLNIALTLDAEATVDELIPKLEQAKGMAAMFSGGKVTAEMITVGKKGTALTLTVAIPKAVLDELAAATNSN